MVKQISSISGILFIFFIKSTIPSLTRGSPPVSLTFFIPIEAHSLTDKCNLRCAYCMEKDHNYFIHNDKIMTLD